MALKKQRDYPRLTNVKDQDVKESLRLLWNQVYTRQDHAEELEALLTEARATISEQATTISTLQKKVIQLAPALGTDKPNTANGTLPQPGGGGGGGTGTGGGGSTTDPGGSTGDGGDGNTGCSTAGSTGHLDPGYPMNLVSAGQIICGVGNEFASLRGPAVDMPTRTANQNELLDRMVWHMNLQGFPCSRYPTTNGSLWLLLFNIGSTQYAYRVIDYAAQDAFNNTFNTLMVYSGQTPNNSNPPDGGIPD